MTVLVTGAAGFIGYHVCEALLGRGDRVVGVDSLNAYYDVALKQARLAKLRQQRGFAFVQKNIADRDLADTLNQFEGIDRVVHLAAQAGVRYSLENPHAYVEANVVGHLQILELCRHLKECRHLVYASSSSVYGSNRKIPFAVGDPVDHPISLYAATKRADELISYAYSHLFGVPQTGLRFFTVYGPWGRPDMALYIFTRAIANGEPIRLFNGGDMKRDFTYVDDIVAGVLAALDRAPPLTSGVPHRVYNLGNHRPEPLPRLIALIEGALGRKAQIMLEPMQPGDVKETYADIEDAERDLGFRPVTPIDVGVPRFVEWYRAYHASNAS
ncbi:MAG: NAD-dependent epimerase/dehydratase family protein [Alphaproteobacteria bacterium]|nr:NAD-dependent epimerase/dehydratase family protein [Alphaproteobacteria bacterium]